MSKLNVLVTDYEYETLAYESSVLERIGAQLVPAQCRTREEIIAKAKDADALLVQYAQIDAEILKALPRLRAIARYGVGVDVIDVDAATAAGVCVVNVPDYCEHEVSDHAFALLLASARKIVHQNQIVKSGTWDYNLSKPVYRIQDKTLGIVGFGKISRRLAQKARAFGLNILVYDPYVEKDLESEYHVQLVGLNDLMRQSDFVSVHTPLTNTTQGMIGEKQLALMKDSSVIINTARGPVIDEPALIHALESGSIAGAALDVLAHEPVKQDNPLLKMDNVILTMHIGWYSEEAQVELQTKAAQGIADVLTGKKPDYLVNASVWPQRKKGWDGDNA